MRSGSNKAHPDIPTESRELKRHSCLFRLFVSSRAGGGLRRPRVATPR